MTRKEYEIIKQLLEESKTPMWFNSNFPVLCITCSSCEKIVKILETMIDE